MRGQGYNGASNLSSDVAGVQARIKEVAQLATYIHCNSHCLNLVISKICKYEMCMIVCKVAVAFFLIIQNDQVFLN